MADVVSLISKFAEFIFSFERRRRAFAWAYYGAPGFVVLLIMLWLGISGGMSFYSGSLTVIPLKTQIENRSDSNTSSIDRREGFVLIASDESAEFSIPLHGKSTGKVWTSLSPNATRTNEDRIRLGGSKLQVRMPLYGVGDPFVAVVESDLPSHVEFLGHRVPLDRFYFKSRQSAALLMCTIISAMFGFGVTLSSGSILEALSAKKRGRQERTRENEDEVVVRNGE